MESFRCDLKKHERDVRKNTNKVLVCNWKGRGCAFATPTLFLSHKQINVKNWRFRKLIYDNSTKEKKLILN